LVTVLSVISMADFTQQDGYIRLLDNRRAFVRIRLSMVCTGEDGANCTGSRRTGGDGDDAQRTLWRYLLPVRWTWNALPIGVRPLPDRWKEEDPSNELHDD
jgi:hypothetical protein